MFMPKIIKCADERHSQVKNCFLNFTGNNLTIIRSSSSNIFMINLLTCKRAQQSPDVGSFFSSCFGPTQQQKFISSGQMFAIDLGEISKEKCNIIKYCQLVLGLTFISFSATFKMFISSMLFRTDCFCPVSLFAGEKFMSSRWKIQIDSQKIKKNQKFLTNKFNFCGIEWRWNQGLFKGGKKETVGGFCGL